MILIPAHSSVAYPKRLAQILLLWILGLSPLFAVNFTYDFQDLAEGELYNQDGWQSPFLKQPNWKSPQVTVISESEIATKAVRYCNESASDAVPDGPNAGVILALASRKIELGYGAEKTLRIEFFVQRTSTVNGAIGGMVGIGTARLFPAQGGLFYGGWAIREEAKSKGGVGGEVHKFLYKQDGTICTPQRNHWYHVRLTYHLRPSTQGGATGSMEVKDMTLNETTYTQLYLDPLGKSTDASLGLASDPASWDTLALRLGTSDPKSSIEGGKIAKIHIYSVAD